MSRMEGTDRGSATVLGLGLIGVLVTILIGGLALGAALATGQRARAAADMAAIAGAAAILEGVVEPDQVCTRAARLAQVNGAQVRSCRLVPGESASGGVVEVTVTREVPGVPRWSATVTARAGLVADTSGQDR